MLMAWKHNYDELLKKARSQLPSVVFEKKRFEVPRVRGLVQGNKTIINNFKTITDYIARKPEHLMKYLLRELATQGDINGPRAVFTGRFSSTALNEKVNKYVNEFVKCKECGKPDTKLVKEDRLTFIKCMACGGKKPVRSIK